MNKREKKIDYIDRVSLACVMMSYYNQFTDEDVEEIRPLLEGIKFLLGLKYDLEYDDEDVETCVEIAVEIVYIIAKANLRNSISLN